MNSENLQCVSELFAFIPPNDAIHIIFISASSTLENDALPQGSKFRTYLPHDVEVDQHTDESAVLPDLSTSYVVK